MKIGAEKEGESGAARAGGDHVKAVAGPPLPHQVEIELTHTKREFSVRWRKRLIWNQRVLSGTHLINATFTNGAQNGGQFRIV